MKRIAAVCIIQVVFILSVRGQLNNSAFYNARALDSARSQKLYLNFDILLFTKNNEYFNQIADGFTLFGFQFAPFFSYYASENVRVDGGIYLQKDFGNSDFTEITPLLSVKFKLGPFSQIIGTLDGAQNHEYIEPLYDFERTLINRLENGMQTKFRSENIFFDMWVDWETMIYKGDPKQEVVSGGISFYYDKYLGNHRLRFPVQFIAHHHGGQIDNSPDPILTIWNQAVGISYAYFTAADSWIRAVHSDNYYLFYKNFTPSNRLAFDDGDGIYLNLSVETRIDLELMASYWLGREFISVKGGQLYPSISSTFKFPDNVEPYRELIIFRMMHNLNINENVSFSARAEPYYDIRNRRWDYSFGFYLNYYPDFFLSQIRGNP